MSRSRVPFLPIFFTILAIAFGFALAARIRAYNTPAGATEASRDASSTISGPVAPTRGASSTDVTAGDGSSSNVSSSTTRSAGLSPREQRYRELLNAPPPPGAMVVNTPVQRPQVTPPKAPPPAATRVAAATKNAFSGSSAQAQAQQGQRPPAGTRPPGDDGGRGRQEKDPTTDTTPPQLQLVQFDPLQVRDGETANVIVTATDDMAGIRGISGTVTSPNGKALQGFACQREGPESNRYIGRVTIPKDAEQGNWHINFLNLSDMASNSVTLAYAQSPLLQAAVLKVTSSRPDNTPPTVKNVWIDRRAMHAGERNTLFVQAEDDSSGVNLVSGVFLSPTKLARIGVSCRAGDGEVWQCDFTVPSCLDCGDWQLEQIQLQDKASNMGAARLDNPVVAAVKVNISGESCDAGAPTLQGVVLETNQVPSTAEGTLVDVRVTVTDDGCGVASVSAQVIGPQGGSGQFFAFSPAGEPTWVGRMPIPRLAGKGVWKINWLQVMDKGNNLRVYYAGDPLLANAFVNVR